MIGDKEYEFASEKAYDTYLKLATSAAKQNGITRREAFEGNYQKYVDVNSPLIGTKAKTNGTTYKESSDIPGLEHNSSTPSVSTPTYSASTYYQNIMKNAADQQKTAYSYAENVRKQAEKLAAKERAQAEALADIERQRGVVDSSTVAEQQKASYGSNAETLGRMGLNVSGYSDYLNSQAYASGMAMRQKANANATVAYQNAADAEWAAKNKAMYTEQLAKLEADKGYYDTLASVENIKYSDYKEEEARKYAEQKEEAARQQALYTEIIKGLGDGSINQDNINLILQGAGLSTEKNTVLSDYASNMLNTEEKEANELAAFEAALQRKDFITAGDMYIKKNYSGLSLTDQKTHLATFMVDYINSGDIDDSQWSAIAAEIEKGDNGKYGAEGGKRIKEAFTNSEYVASADSLGTYELKAIIDSGLLTNEAKNRLKDVYAHKLVMESMKPERRGGR